MMVDNLYEHFKPTTGNPYIEAEKKSGVKWKDGEAYAFDRGYLNYIHAVDSYNSDVQMVMEILRDEKNYILSDRLRKCLRCIKEVRPSTMYHDKGSFREDYKTRVEND